MGILLPKNYQMNEAEPYRLPPYKLLMAFGDGCVMISNQFFVLDGKIIQREELMAMYASPGYLDSCVDGDVELTYSNGVCRMTIEGVSELVKVNKPVLVDRFEYNRVFDTNVTSTIVLPFSLSDASKITSGMLYDVKDIVPAESNYTVSLSDSPVTSVQANHPYIYLATSSTFNLSLNANEKLLVVPTVDSPSTTLDTTSGTWCMRGTYSKLIFGNIPDFAEKADRFYGYASTTIGDIPAGKFVKVNASASIRPMRAYFEYMTNI